MKYIVKRNGSLEEFNINKIINALKKAFISVDEYYDEDLLQSLASDIVEKLNISKTDLPTVEFILDMIEETLMDKKYYNVAKSFIIYRNERTKARELTYKEEYDLSFIEHHEYKDKLITVWDYHEVSHDIYELDVWELFKDGIGELTHIKDLKNFSDILCMKLISYKDYNGTIILKYFEEALSKAIKNNYIRYYYDYLYHGINLLCSIDTDKVLLELKQLEIKPDLDNTKYLDNHRAILTQYGIDDMVITHILQNTLKSAYKHINKVVYYYVTTIDDVLLSYQECVSEILPVIKIELKHPTNIEEMIAVEALIKITGIGDIYE